MRMENEDPGFWRTVVHDVRRRSGPIRRRVRRRGSRDAALQERVQNLEAEMQECRRLNRRIAELTDLVAHTLLPASERDDERLAALLERYRQQLS
jgi:hypothetical protein